jgi:sporadic carbohydrate cluster protein (TIGR04323 family)
MKIFKGYISSRKFLNGEYVQQKLQNIVVRQFCEYLNCKYMLSDVEYIFKDNFSILDNLLKCIKNYDGIAFFSIFQLPTERDNQEYYLKKIINNNKLALFSNEKLIINSLQDVNYALDLIDIYCETNKVLLNNQINFFPK